MVGFFFVAYQLPKDFSCSLLLKVLEHGTQYGIYDVEKMTSLLTSKDCELLGDSNNG